MNLQQIRLVGGIGTILLLASAIPDLGELSYAAGLVMLLTAVFTVEQRLQGKPIFLPYLLGMILPICAVIVVVVVGGTTAFSMWTSLGATDDLTRGVVLLAVVAAVAVYLALVIGAGYQASALATMAEGLHHGLFKWAGQLIFWGSVLLIVLGLGAILIFIGFIVLAIAFFTIPEQPA